jgi:hypothetical protein
MKLHALLEGQVMRLFAWASIVVPCTYSGKWLDSHFLTNMAVLLALTCWLRTALWQGELLLQA